jgi:hypothetical protein
MSSGRAQCQIYSPCRRDHGRPRKHIPVTEPMLRHFRQCGLDSLLWYSARVRPHARLPGRHLFLGGSTALSPIPESSRSRPTRGDLSGIAALNLPPWVERQFFEPGSEIAQMPTGRRRSRPSPSAPPRSTSRSWRESRAGCCCPGAIRCGLGARARPGAAPAGDMAHFECFIHGGVPIAPFQDELRSILGPTVNFHEVYPPSEAFIAAQDADAAEGPAPDGGRRDLLRVHPDDGVRGGQDPAPARPEGRAALGREGRGRLRARPHDPGGPRPLRHRGHRALRHDRAAAALVRRAGPSSG